MLGQYPSLLVRRGPPFMVEGGPKKLYLKKN
jgi:hypothetical protein